MHRLSRTARVLLIDMAPPRSPVADDRGSFVFARLDREDLDPIVWKPPAELTENEGSTNR